VVFLAVVFLAALLVAFLAAGFLAAAAMVLGADFVAIVISVKGFNYNTKIEKIFFINETSLLNFLWCGA
jgi:hypothetical protein